MMIKLLGYIVTIDECSSRTGLEVMLLINSRLAEISSCEGVDMIIVEDGDNSYFNGDDPNFKHSVSNLKFMGIKNKSVASQ